MKTLVAATCVALLAAIGYYFYGEYTAFAESKRISEMRFSRDACMAILSDAENGKTDGLVSKLTGCLLSGAISQADIDNSVARAKARHSQP